MGGGRISGDCDHTNAFLASILWVLGFSVIGFWQGGELVDDWVRIRGWIWTRDLGFGVSTKLVCGGIWFIKRGITCYCQRASFMSIPPCMYVMYVVFYTRSGIFKGSPLEAVRALSSRSRYLCYVPVEGPRHRIVSREEGMFVQVIKSPQSLLRSSHRLIVPPGVLFTPRTPPLFTSCSPPTTASCSRRSAPPSPGGP